MAGPFPRHAGSGSDARRTGPRFVEWASGYTNYIREPINKSFHGPQQTSGRERDGPPADDQNSATAGKITDLRSPMSPAGQGPGLRRGFGNSR